MSLTIRHEQPSTSPYHPNDPMLGLAVRNWLLDLENHALEPAVQFEKPPREVSAS